MMAPDDTAMFAIVRRELWVAVVGDVLDRMGFRHQYLPPTVRMLAPDMVILGRAMPVLEVDAAEVTGRLADKPFGVAIEAVDDLRSGEVFVAGRGSDYALWGAVMTTRALACGAAGAVLHGWHRDTDEILRAEFPVASFGGYAPDPSVRGRVVDWRVPVEVAGVHIAPGDIIFGDREGVLVVPQVVAEQTFAEALQKAHGENKVIRAVRSGMTAAEAIAMHGVI